MKEWLEGRLEADPPRAEAAALAKPEADVIARRLPLVHRTGGRKAPGWKSILDSGSIGLGEAGTEIEKQHGHAHAVYFFVGSGAYPHGDVALLLPFSSCSSLPATFTPFDSGGLWWGYMAWVTGGQVPRDESERLYLDLHAEIDDLPDFLGLWMAAHHADPMDHVRKPLISEPDWLPLHGFRSQTGYRLAWTIETRFHEAVPLSVDTCRVLLARKDLAMDVPVSWLGASFYPPDDSEDGGPDFHDYIKDEILKGLEAA